MIGRIYVKSKDDKKIVVEYYDYDNINEDGSNLVHIISFIRDKRKLFDRIYARRPFESPFINKEFGFENGWEDLKEYLKKKKVKYSYKKIKLSEEGRYKTQQEQSSIKRDVHVCANAERYLDIYKEMNQFERKEFLRYCEELVSSYNSGHEFHYECSTDYEDDVFSIVQERAEFEDDEARHNCKNPGKPRYLREYKQLPKAIKQFVEKWHKDGIDACKYVSWEAKLATYFFIYRNTLYELYPSAMDLDDTQVDHISGEILSDLQEIGCKCITYNGMLD